MVDVTVTVVVENLYYGIGNLLLHSNNDYVKKLHHWIFDQQAVIPKQANVDVKMEDLVIVVQNYKGTTARHTFHVFKQAAIY